MGHSNTPHVRAYTRKTYGKPVGKTVGRTLGRTLGQPIKTVGTRRKRFPTMKRNTVVPVNNNSRRVKPRAFSEKAKQKIKLLVRVYKKINELSETTGLKIDEYGHLLSSEGGEILLDQYQHLIDGLQEQLDYTHDYHTRLIFEKAIQFVKKQRTTNLSAREVDPLAEAMARL
jgi:hypothetical protein